MSTLFVVSTPIGNLEDLSRRAERVLAEVDMIAAEDTRSAKRLLSHLGIEGKRVVSCFEGNEAKRAEQFVEKLQEGLSIALISEAGTPLVSDPGQRFVAAARAAGVKVVVVPGASALLTALVGSGLPCSEFRFLAFPPRGSGPRQELFGRLRNDPATLIFYESPERVLRTVEELALAFGETRRAVLSRELTKRYEEYRSGTLQELADGLKAEPARGECTLVVAGATEVEVVDPEELVRELLAEGLGPKDVAAKLMIRTGRPRRELYQLALALQRTDRSE